MFARFVDPGSECRVDLYKSEAIIFKDEFSTLGHTILKGRHTPKKSSNSSPKPLKSARTSSVAVFTVNALGLRAGSCASECVFLTVYSHRTLPMGPPKVAQHSKRP